MRLLLLLALLTPAYADISFIGQCTGTTSCTAPTHAIGDLFLAYAGRDGSQTAPALPSGWTSVGTQSINGTGSADSSVRLACKVATSTTETITGFTNAGTVVAHVYRGQESGLTAVCASAILGTPSFFATAPNSTSVTETFNSVTNANAFSWNVGFGFCSACILGIDTAPSGMTNRASIGIAPGSGGHDTNGPVASFTTADVTLVTAGRIITVVVEIQYQPTCTGTRTLIGVGC